MRRGMTADEFQAAVKQAIQVCEGSVQNAAHVLGMPPNALSHALNPRGLVGWWTKYKSAKVLETARAKARRRYRRRKLRALLEAGYDQATAEYLASQDMRRTKRALREPMSG